MATLAIHLVWTSYGTWLPGDDRGHWSPLFDLYGRIREQGGQLRLPDTTTRRRAVSLAKESPKLLDADEMQIVAAVIGTHIAPGLPGETPHIAPGLPGETPHIAPGLPGETPYPRQAGGYMKPVAWAAAVEANHVRLLVGPVEEDLAKCVGRMKGTSSSAVGQLPRNRDRRRVWTEGYWRVFLFDALGVGTVKRYIDDHNRRRGLAVEPFPWLSKCPLK